VRAAVILALVAGCAHQPKVQKVEFEGAIITPNEVIDARTLFEQAGVDLSEKSYADAAKKYDLITSSFRDSPLVMPSFYNAGLAYEGLDDYKTACDRYRSAAERAGDTTDGVDARYKLGACLAELGNWPASREIYTRLLERKDLGLGDRMEAQTRKGYAEFKLGDLATAERTFNRAVEDFIAHETDERLDTNFFLGMSQYHIGLIAHERYKQAQIHLPEKRMAEELEVKAGLALDAQAKYVKAIKVKNPDWAAAAGYQIGALYRDFYDSMINAPLPDPVKADAELREVYFEELKKKIRPLLEKALRTQEQTVMMAERTGVMNDFVRKSSAELDALRRLLAPEGHPEDRPPMPQAPSQKAPPPGKRTDGAAKTG
jgi:tetratricopeptide (TPR) repeat protein